MASSPAAERQARSLDHEDVAVAHGLVEDHIHLPRRMQRLGRPKKKDAAGVIGSFTVYQLHGKMMKFTLMNYGFSWWLFISLTDEEMVDCQKHLFFRGIMCRNRL